MAADRPLETIDLRPKASSPANRGTLFQGTDAILNSSRLSPNSPARYRNRVRITILVPRAVTVNVPCAGRTGYGYNYRRASPTKSRIASDSIGVSPFFAFGFPSRSCRTADGQSRLGSSGARFASHGWSRLAGDRTRRKCCYAYFRVDSRTLRCLHHINLKKCY